MTDIDVTDLDVTALIRSAFDHSRPQGMGLFHHKPGAMTSEELDAGQRKNGGFRYDYVRGRSMKLTILVKDGRRWWEAPWYDHTPQQQIEVLKAAGMAPDDIRALMGD